MKQIFNKLILTIIISLIFSEIYEGHLLYSPGGGGGGQGGGFGGGGPSQNIDDDEIPF